MHRMAKNALPDFAPPNSTHPKEKLVIHISSLIIICAFFNTCYIIIFKNFFFHSFLLLSIIFIP